MASPEIVDRAVRTGLITAGEASHYLDDPPPKPKPKQPLAIVPKLPPPPERLALVSFAGRVRKGRQRLTRALIAAGVVDREEVRGKEWATPKPGADQHDQEGTA